MRRLLLCTVLLAACGGPSPAAPLPAQRLEIRFIDVGQGDAILLRYGDHAALVDAGLPDAGTLAVLRSLHVDSLQLFIASHNHGDHIGGAAALIRAMPVGVYLENDATLHTPNQLRVDSAIQLRGVPRERAPRRTFRWGDVRLDVMPPPPGVDTAQNNHSLIVVVQLGRFRALLTGDSERSETDALLAQDSIRPVSLLKAPHHGDSDAPSPEWIRRMNPGVVVVSVGKGNLSEDARKLYESAGRRMFSTDRDGDVIVTVDHSGTYAVQTGPHRGH